MWPVSKASTLPPFGCLQMEPKQRQRYCINNENILKLAAIGSSPAWTWTRIFACFDRSLSFPRSWPQPSMDHRTFAVVPWVIFYWNSSCFSSAFLVVWRNFLWSMSIVYCVVVNVNDISMHSIPFNYKQPQYGGPLQISIVLPFILPCIACQLSTIAVGFIW